MKYTQIIPKQVFTSIAGGYNVIICDFNDAKIYFTNDLTVETIRNYLAKTDVVFFRAEPEVTD